MTRPALPIALLVCAALAAGCERNPDALTEHLRRGDQALAEGRYGDAVVAYQHAHELGLQDPRVQHAMMRARVYVMAESPGRVSVEALDDVRYEALLLLEQDRAHAAVYLTALGNVLARRGDAEAAKLKLAEALQADPSSPLAHTALGVVLMSRREGASQAKVELELALKAKPDCAGALVALGQIQLAEGDLVGAAEHLEAALRIGDDFTARMALGNARLQQQKSDDAAEHFQRAARLDPKSADAWSALGQALLNAGKAEEAERALRTSAQLRPDTATAVALGFALARQKKPEPALDVFGQVLAQDARAAPALYGAGAVSEELGRKEQAEAYYQRLLALPAEGPQRQTVIDLQREAQGRMTALAAAVPSSAAPAAPATGASAAPAAGAPAGGAGAAPRLKR